MEEKILLQQGNNIQIKFVIKHTSDKKLLTLTSNKYLCGAVYFQLQAISTRCITDNENYADYNTILCVKFTKVFKDDDLMYSCKVSSTDLNNFNQKITEQNTWHQIFVHNQPNVTTANSYFTFTISFHSDIFMSTSPFAQLYEDMKSTDFKLCGEEGSCEVHKLVLKVSSPVLKGMLSGEWQETSEGLITVDANKETLDNFKDYIYLNKLPNTGIEHLLLLGSYFMMPDLVQKCLVKLLNKVDADNIVEMIEFAAKFKVTNLFVTLLNIIRNGVVNIDHLSEDNLIDMCQATNSVLNIKK